MISIKEIRLIVIVSVLMTMPVSAQGLNDFLGTWTGVEDLESNSNTYSNRNITLTISEGGDREGFLVYTSSSDFLFNESLNWVYHYFSIDKDTDELIFHRRFITPIGLIGNQEIRYQILEWTGAVILAEYYSSNNNEFHQLRISQETLAGDILQPKDFYLGQNFPNPFNPSTTIQLEINKSGAGSINIYNINGEIVHYLFDGNFSIGTHEFQWDGTNNLGQPLSAGTYIYRLNIDGFSQSQKMVLLK